MSSTVITNLQQLITLLNTDPTLVSAITDETKHAYITRELTLTRLIQGVLLDKGHSVTLGLIKELVANQAYLMQFFPDVAQQWARLTNPDDKGVTLDINKDNIFESNPTEDFLEDIKLNAADPFRATRSFASRFSTSKVNTHTGSFRLNAARTSESYRTQSEFYTGRLEKTINRESSLFKSLESRASVYGEVSGYYGRATELDYFSMFTQGERGREGFKGSFFQLQESSTLSALYNREGKTQVATQLMTAADYNDERLDSPNEQIRQDAAKNIRDKFDILAGNTLSVSLAHRYGDQTNLEVSGVTMAEGSIHAKIGYFYREIEGSEKITGILMSTQNITPTLSKTTTVEDMLLINRPVQKAGEDESAYKARLNSFHKLSYQVAAASNAMLSLMSTSASNQYDGFNRSKQFIDEFTRRINKREGLTHSNRLQDGGVFANHEILPALQGIIGGAAKDKSRYVSISMQYIEQALLEKNVLGDDTFTALETLAKENRLRIGVSAGSMGENQGLFYLLDALNRKGNKQGKQLIKTLIDNDSFTVLPTQLQHSKSLAVFEKGEGESFKLIEYFLGSANISKNALVKSGADGTTTNIETSMLVKGDYLDLLTEEDIEGITGNYLLGIGNRFSTERQTQGMLIERRGDPKQVKKAIEMLDSLGALDAQDKKNDNKSRHLWYSRRYILDKSEPDKYKLSGIDVIIGDRSQGERTYTLGFTVATERKFVPNGMGGGKVQEVPIVYINKTQRMIGGIVYKNAVPADFTFQSFNLETGKIEAKTLKQGESYTANAMDVLGGIASTMRAAMLYDSNVRALVGTYRSIDQEDLKYSVDKMLSETIQTAYTTINKGKKLKVNSNDLTSTIAALRQLNKKDAKEVLVKVSSILNVGESTLSNHETGIRGEEISNLIKNVSGLLGGQKSTASVAEQTTLMFHNLIKDSLGLFDIENPNGGNFTQRYSDLAKTVLINTESGYNTYRREIEEGRGQIYHRIVDALQQPHTQNYSQGQALHALPVYGLTSTVHKRLDSFMAHNTGLILNPYGLMHGEALGSQRDKDGFIVGGEYQRGVSKGSGRQENEDFFEAYGGLEKIEGGAPVVYDNTGLANSMPTLQALKRKSFKKDTLAFLQALGVNKAEEVTKALTDTAYSVVRGDEEDENDVIFYYPYAKTEQISQRMGNLTSTRPMFDASNEFIKYALSFGASGEYGQFRDSTKIIDGALPGSLPTQQFEALQQEYEARGGKSTYLEIAKEWSMRDEGMGKGYIGSARPRLISIIMGATQLSDYGIYNPEYNMGSEEEGLYEQGMKYLKPHRIQVSGTLSSLRTSPTYFLQKIQEVLKPGTIFVARDSVVKSNDLLDKFAEDIGSLVKRQLIKDDSVNPDSISSWSVETKDLTGEGLFAKAQELVKLSGGALTSSEIDRGITEALNQFKAHHKAIQLGYETDISGKKLSFKVRKGVYSPTAFTKANYEGVDLYNPLVSIGDVEPGDAQFTLRAFSFFEGGTEYKVSPMKIAVPAHSARELNAYSVLGSVALNSNTSNTFLLDAETYTVEDFMSGMRAGTILPKGPFRGGRAELFETLADIYDGVQTDLLPAHMQRKVKGDDKPRRISAKDIFAYVSPSQIKGFNFEMGLGLLAGGESGSSQLITRMKDGKKLAQSIALMFLGSKEDAIGGSLNKKLLLSSLAKSLGNDESQFATALKIQADNIKATGDKFSTFESAQGVAGLSIFSSLASLVSIDLDANEGIESALLRTVIDVLRDDTDATDKLSERSSKLLDYLFNKENKLFIKDDGSDKITIKDTFETKPIGLLAFLAKASSDLYANIDLDSSDESKNRYNIGGLGEAVMSDRSIFENLDDIENPDGRLDNVKNILNRVNQDDPKYKGIAKSKRELYKKYQVIQHRRELYKELMKLRKVTKGGLDQAFMVHNLLSEGSINTHTSNFIGLLNEGPNANRRLALEEVVNSDSVSRQVAFMYGNEAATKLMVTDTSRGASIYQLATQNYTSRLSMERKKQFNEKDALNLLRDRDEGALSMFKQALREELESRNLQVGEPSRIISRLMKDNEFGIEGGLTEQDVRSYIEILGEEDLLSQSKKPGSIGYYTALEAYAGLAGPVLENAQRTMANAFGYALPEQRRVKEILQRIHAGDKISDREEQVLKEAEFSLNAIRDSIQQQRAILMPAEFAMSKIATPTGSKNVTALEGHVARSMTQRQLESYTYSPNQYTDVGSVQEALFTLARIYEGTLPRNKQITSKYQLRLHHLGFGAVAGQSELTQNTKLKEKALLLSQMHQTESTVVDYLVNYNPLFRKPLAGENTSLDAGVEMLYSLLDGTEENVKTHMEKVNQIALGEVGSASMSFEEQIERRVYLLAEYIYDQRGGSRKVEDRINSMLSPLRSKGDMYINDLRQKQDKTEEEKSLVNLWEKHRFETNPIDLIQKALLKESREAEILRIGSLGGLRSKIMHAQSTNEGNAYLEAMKSLYTTAVNQEKYSTNSKLREEAARQKSLLKTSRFIALPNYTPLSSDFEGNIVLTHRPQSYNQKGFETGVILGLDVLEKMSLLFQTDSHPALKAQHLLIKQLSKTQHIIDRLEVEMLQTGKSTVTQEEYQELQSLQNLMTISKEVTLDILQNKNSIRQATSNRLNMMGASYIAVNSLLVGQDEVALGSRAERHAGSETTGGSLRYTGSVRPSYKELESVMYDPSGYKFLSISQSQAAKLEEKASILNDPAQKTYLEEKAQAWRKLALADIPDRVSQIEERLAEVHSEINKLNLQISAERSSNQNKDTVRSRTLLEQISELNTEISSLDKARELATQSRMLVFRQREVVPWAQHAGMKSIQKEIERIRGWATRNAHLDPELKRLADISNRLLANKENFKKAEYIEWQDLVKSISRKEGDNEKIFNVLGLPALEEDVDALRASAESNLKNWEKVNEQLAATPEKTVGGKTYQQLLEARQRSNVSKPFLMFSDEIDSIKETASKVQLWLNKSRDGVGTRLQTKWDEVKNKVNPLINKILSGNGYIEFDDYEAFIEGYKKVRELGFDYKGVMSDGLSKKLKGIETTLRMGVLSFNTRDRLDRIKKDATNLDQYDNSIKQLEAKKNALETDKNIKTLLKAEEQVKEASKTLKKLKHQEKVATAAIKRAPQEKRGAYLVGLVSLQQKIKNTQEKIDKLSALSEKIRSSKSKIVSGKTVGYSLLLLTGGYDESNPSSYIQSYSEQIAGFEDKIKTISAKKDVAAKLNEWSARLRELAKAYGNDAYEQITSAYVLQKLETAGSRTDLFELEIITGEKVRSKDKRETLAEVDRRALQEGIQIGRQGAPYKSFSSSRGPNAGITGVTPISADEMYNERIRETGSLFGTDANSSSTLMMISAFGFQYVGLGDFDGDSYQAALTSVTKIRGNISRLSENRKDLERTITKLQEAKRKDISDERKTALQKEIEVHKASLKQIKSLEVEAQSQLLAVREQSREATLNKVEKAKEGARSYTSDYLALPSYLLGSDDDKGKFAFTDSDVAGMVKQFRDTLGGLYDRAEDSDRAVGGFAYLKMADDSTSEDSKLSGTNFVLDKEALIEEKGASEAHRIAEAVTTWHKRFMQYEEPKLEDMSLEDYQTNVKRWIPTVESVFMSMSTAGKILKNASGSQISSTDLHSIQSLMGQTGGGLLGQVYNTVVPSVTGQIGDHLMNRLMNDDVSKQHLQKSIAATKQRVEDNTDNYEYAQQVQAALTNMGRLTTDISANKSKVKGNTPWEIVMKNSEKMASSAYRFLLSTQQFLRDAALKPKEKAGLVPATANFQLSPQAQKLIERLDISGLDQEKLSKTVGYDNILKFEEIARNDKNKGRQYLEIVSQDFLGSAANTVLNSLYKKDGEKQKIDQNMTAFAMLRLITDYAGGSGKSINEMYDTDNYLYAPALQQAHARMQEDNENITREDTVKSVITDLLGRFQANFITKSVMEDQKGISIKQTEDTLLAHGIELKVDEETGQYSLNHSLKESPEGGLNKAKLGYKQTVENLITEHILAERRVVNDSNEEVSLDDIHKWLKNNPQEKKNSITEELRGVRGKLIKHLEDSLEEINQEVTKGNTEKAQSMVKERTFETIIRHTTEGQTKEITEQLTRLREFNQTVRQIENSGQSSNMTSHLFNTLSQANVDAQKALLEDASMTGLFSSELQASAYATDTGKLTNENLYRAFSTGIMAVSDAVTEQVETGNITKEEAKGVFSYLAMGGALPEPIEQTYRTQEEIVRSKAEENIRAAKSSENLEKEEIDKLVEDEVGSFRVSFLKALAYSDGTTPSVLESVAQNSGYVAAVANWQSIAEQSNTMLSYEDELTEEEQKEYLKLAETASEKLEQLNPKIRQIRNEAEEGASKFNAPEAPEQVEENKFNAPELLEAPEDNKFNMPESTDSAESPKPFEAPEPPEIVDPDKLNQPEVPNVMQNIGEPKTPEMTGTQDRPSSFDVPEIEHPTIPMATSSSLEADDKAVVGNAPELTTPSGFSESTQEIEPNAATRPLNPQTAPPNPAYLDEEGIPLNTQRLLEDVDVAQHTINKLTRSVERRHEVEALRTAQTKQDAQLRKTFGVAESLSILAVPMIFAAIQGDIPVGEQVQGLISDTIQSGLTMGSFEESTINSMAKGDIAGLEKMRLAASKLEHARMRDYFSYYNSPTEALARSFGNELMIRGMGAIGNELGTLFDLNRGIDPFLASETGAGRVITEVAAGMIGKVVSGALTGAPVGNYNTTQTDISAAIMENAAESIQSIQNYIMDSMSNIATELDDEYNQMEAKETENSTTVAIDLRSSGDNFNPEIKTALSPTEYAEKVQNGDDDVSIAQELGLINYDSEPFI